MPANFQPRFHGRSVTLLGAGLIALGLVPALADEAATRDADAMLVYFGTYTGPKSSGIYISRLDLTRGLLSPPELAAEVVSPAFLALHPNRRFLYAVNEVGESQGRVSGAVTAFALDPQSGRLTPLNQESSRGGGPCHLTLDRTGRTLLVANYGGGSVAALPVSAEGRVGAATAFVQHQGSSVNPARQQGPHAHGVYVDAANRFALVPDLGLDQVLIYRLDPAKATLAPHEPAAARVAPGAGPRHLAFHPRGRQAYVINELLSTITVFDYDAARGTLQETQTLSTLPEGWTGNNTTAEIAMHPSGQFLYGSNRGHDSLAIFAVAEDGRLTPVGHQPTLGKTPRNFAIDPTGRFLLAANQGSDSVALFRLNPATGRLKSTGQLLTVGSPVCVLFLAP